MKNLTLEKAYEMVQAAEETAEETHVKSGEQTVYAVKANSRQGQGHRGCGGPSQLRYYAKKQKFLAIECKFCSYEHAPVRPVLHVPRCAPVRPVVHVPRCAPVRPVVHVPRCAPVRPVVHVPRCVPVPVQEKVCKKIDELVCDGVLMPVI